MNSLLIVGIFNIAAFVSVLLALFILRFKYKRGTEIYPIALIIGGLIWAAGQVVGWLIGNLAP